MSVLVSVQSAYFVVLSNILFQLPMLSMFYSFLLLFSYLTHNYIIFITLLSFECIFWGSLDQITLKTYNPSLTFS